MIALAGPFFDGTATPKAAIAAAGRLALAAALLTRQRELRRGIAALTTRR